MITPDLSDLWPGMLERPAQARRAEIVEMERVRDPGVAWRDLFGT